MKYKARYYVGDSRDLRKLSLLRKISKPNLIISSPPYFDLLDYEGTTAQIGYGQNDYEKYLSEVAKVFQDCYEISKPDATFWLIIDTFKKGGELKLLPFDIYRKLNEQNKITWKLKDVIIWDKEKNLPWNSKGKLKNQFEYILFFSKGEKYNFNIDSVREINDLKKWWLTYPERYNPNGKAPSNVWHFTTPIRGWGDSKQDHFCPIPFPLAEKIISIASNKNDVIFDPFAGSGSALAMAAIMDRQAYGVDINRQYKIKFEKEVIKGAKRYWQKRKDQLEYNKGAIKNFSSTNNKLRKLKVASVIASYINKKNSNPFVHILIDKPESKFDLFVVENSLRPIIKIIDDELENLIRQAKVQPNIQIITIEELKHIKPTKLNRYAFEKFYFINSIVYKKNILMNKTKYNFIHSNISVQIK